jgi:diguanylate cyclase (GGDEF)-like protein
MKVPVDRFVLRMLLVGVAVVAASVVGSVALTASLSRDLDTEAYTTGILIAVIVPSIVAPLAVSSLIWLIVRNHRLLVEVDRLANHDDLTGLMNRRAFFGRARERMADATGEHAVALALADLDHFKAINDSFGHDAGDRALRHVAQEIARYAPKDALVARIGGEEFAILFDWTSLPDARAMMERVGQAVAASPCPVEGDARVAVTVSIGVAIAGAERDVDALLKRADAAMYAAKDSGRNQTRLAA